MYFARKLVYLIVRASNQLAVMFKDFFLKKDSFIYFGIVLA